ncbi:MAG: tRNA (adenosine(37)-N6)-dimethylallyltransferase MiaA [Flavobacteriales bacterium]|nr:tRNA (adenosine(37)-N6)-dimethylallyltransferase MiaA [Bacteroidota bacterium]MCB9239600.1 tRNA (adenosine(37)-N6)-dimethylallyltransferase MiaA [Flavobacteriales bacterium]
MTPQLSSGKFLIVVGGPTASGKTSWAIELANHFKTEIISADSRQFYRELNIGVARPSEDELQQVNHHFIADRSVRDDYSAGQFEHDALQRIASLHQSHDVVVMVGGSGLFIRAVLSGFHPSQNNPDVRSSLQSRFQAEGLEGLVEELKQKDPEKSSQIDLKNPQRVMRALERLTTEGILHEEQYQSTLSQRPFSVLEVGINHDRSVLYDRINQRVDQMMKDGLLDEVKSLTAFKMRTPLKSVGYTELFDYLDDQCTLVEAVERIKQNTRRFAKRQLTWFRNQSDTCWYEPTQMDNAISDLQRKMKL